MPSPTVRGSTDIHLQPTYPRFKRNARGATLTLVYRGPYETLQTYGPDIGDSIALSAWGYTPEAELIYAESVDCQPLEAGDEGPGELTIVYSNEGGGGTVLSGEVEAPTYEVDSSSLEKRLESHRRYNGKSGSPFLPYSFTPGSSLTTTFPLNSVPHNVVSVAEFWDDFKNARVRERPALRGEIPPDAPELLAMIDELTVKFLSGIEGYIVAAPVCRKTSRSYFKPATSGTGTRGAPSGFPDAPSGYIWLKTADRAVRQGTRGKWERVEEWTAADHWDTELYPT